MLNRLPQLPVYPMLPIDLVSGRGAIVTDAAGVDYLDMYGGHAVAITGHCHPKVVEAIREQAAALLFYSNVTEHPVRQAFCEKLMALAPGGLHGLFLCNSGAEANENALTLARLATGRRKILSVDGGFHGRTLLTLSLSGLPGYRKLAATRGEPMFSETQVLPFGDIDAAREAIDESCAAVIIEPIQGLGGCRVASSTYLQGLSDACKQAGAKLIFDEVQCGTGRSGMFLAAQLAGVTPDLVTLAKGLAGGFPIGAVLADELTGSAAGAGTLGSTFGGGPLACAAGLANLEAIESEGMMQNAGALGKRLMEQLALVPGVRAVQGAGLMIGIVFNEKAAGVRDRLLCEHHIIAGTSAVPEILRILPPLNLNGEQADQFVAALASVLSDEGAEDLT